MNSVRSWDVGVSRRVDGTPWPLRFHEITGTDPGPTTAFVAGLWGDKPLGVLALHELVRDLASMPLRGRVLVVPAVNLPALEAGTRVSPDHHQLNRRFPGTANGFVTDQIAHRLLTTLSSECDCVIDVHSGTPNMALRYTYDFGDLELSLAWGSLPVIVDHTYPGQLSSAAMRAGLRSCLPEFNGGPFVDRAAGVRGCLNILRYRGQVRGPLEGPPTLPVIRDLQLVLCSTSGAFDGHLRAGDVGCTVPTGTLGSVTCVVTGETLEEFSVERSGGILLMATMTPTIVSPGAYAFMIGFPHDERSVPANGAGAPRT
jgi:predicted deacylase